jgi:hypothetical protein
MDVDRWRQRGGKKAGARVRKGEEKEGSLRASASEEGRE